MDLTRRALIGRAAAASGVLLGGRALMPGLVFAGEDGEAVFEMRAPRLGRFADGWRKAPDGWCSGPIRASRAFELLGVEQTGSDAAIEVRALGADGRWTEGLDARPAHGHGPDGPDGLRRMATGRRRALTDPVWTGRSRAFEMRAQRPLPGARVLLVDSGAPARAAAAKRFVDAGLATAAGQPPIIARSTWATAACRPRVPAVFGAVELAFVHHTVSSNAYRPSQSAAMVRAICLFHKYGNGWNDIGYNFVVDRHGQVFEARAGGIDEAIVGGQAGGYNVYSSGVALLGNFSYGGPPRRMFDALAQLLAWKLSVHGVELPGRTTVHVTPQGAPYSRYRANARVTLNRISGHRDADTTACPGNGTYRQLPRLRQRVRTLGGTLSSLTFQLDEAGPGSVTVSGVLATGGGPPGGGGRRATAAQHHARLAHDRYRHHQPRRNLVGDRSAGDERAAARRLPRRPRARGDHLGWPARRRAAADRSDRIDPAGRSRWRRGVHRLDRAGQAQGDSRDLAARAGCHARAGARHPLRHESGRHLFADDRLPCGRPVPGDRAHARGRHQRAGHLAPGRDPRCLTGPGA